MEAFTKGAMAAAEQEDNLAKVFTQALTEPRRILDARADLEKRLKANIRAYIKQGFLHGFGFETPRRVASVPVEIPKEAWAAQCDWNASTLEFRGLNFVDVRLTTTRYREESVRGQVILQAPTKQPGRPTVGPDIEAAFHALLEAGEIDIEKSQLSHFSKVATWLEINRPELSVAAGDISEKTFRSHLSPLFKALKERKKL